MEDLSDSNMWLGERFEGFYLLLFRLGDKIGRDIDSTEWNQNVSNNTTNDIYDRFSCIIYLSSTTSSKALITARDWAAEKPSLSNKVANRSASK